MVRCIALLPGRHLRSASFSLFLTHSGHEVFTIYALGCVSVKYPAEARCCFNPSLFLSSSHNLSELQYLLAIFSSLAVWTSREYLSTQTQE